MLPDGSIAVADTYNGAVRRFADGRLTTIATDLSEPSGLYVDGRDLVVVESAAHRLTRIPLDARVAADDFSHTTQRPVTDVAATLRLDVPFTPPPGQKVDDRFGPSSQLLVTATPPALIRTGEGRGTDLTRELVLDPHVGDGVLHIAARAASCDVGRRRGRGVPHAPAGLGCAGPDQRRRGRRAHPASRRRFGLTRSAVDRSQPRV